MQIIKNILLILLFNFVSEAFPYAGHTEKVVKGQVSDYFITVTEKREIKGTITDTSGNPLEGATVMFFASPIHTHSDSTGYFSITGSECDTDIYVQYPGKKFFRKLLTSGKENINIGMQEDDRIVQERGKPLVTRWYNPAKQSGNTFCNPANISYNFEPYNDNIKKERSVRRPTLWDWYIKGNIFCSQVTREDFITPKIWPAGNSLMPLFKGSLQMTICVPRQLL